MGRPKGHGPGCPRSRHGRMLLNGSEGFAACSLAGRLHPQREATKCGHCLPTDTQSVSDRPTSWNKGKRGEAWCPAPRGGMQRWRTHDTSPLGRSFCSQRSQLGASGCSLGNVLKIG